MRRAFSGIGATRGLALGRACIVQPQALDIAEERIEPGRVEAELERLHEALSEARRELIAVRERIRGAIALELGEFLDLHALLLEDPELLSGLDQLIRTGHYSADYALKLQRDRLAAVFDSIDDPYMRSRREDLDHVVGRVHAALHRGGDCVDAPGGLAGEVLVTDTIAPSELAQLTERGIVAIVTAQGSALSHSAILARSLHLPLVVGAHEALSHVNDGDAIMVDAGSGQVIVEPNAQDLRRFRQLQRENEREQRQLARLKRKATRTRDEVDIALYANAESRQDVSQALELGAAGIGLYRTEFLFLQRNELPTEEEQFFAYRDVVLGMGGRPVTIRTLDLGADKADSCGLALGAEPNPALGVRGIRLSLREHGLFRTQLRAILRASGYGPLRILLPMVSCREEVLAVRELLLECTRDLRDEGHEIAEQVELGAMIEVPAAALALAGMIRHVDFVSIGTNDLVQYLLAADRNNDQLGSIYSPLHPAVLRLLHEIFALGRRTRTPVLVCGEVAGDERYTRLLLALGLTRFSLHPGSLLQVRRVVRDADLHALRRQAPALLRAADRAGIERALQRLEAPE
ncbi:MAG TPA: phosphoenolpyruvate--protein phosphotransferase [Xanthomonadaceae bacterium]|nr:phosphoenolpyruvate--protein phosphotransferase [Xanthomonadaceae bacterium]